MNVPVDCFSEDVVLDLPNVLELRRHDELWFMRYDRLASAAERVKSADDEKARAAALLQHSRVNVLDMFPIKAGTLSKSRLRLEIDKALNLQKILSITSRCRGGRSFKHIPLMDYRVPAGDGDAHLPLLIEELSKIEMSGTVMRSGKSYHFYGETLLTPRQWRDFLGQSLLMGDLSDTRYIGHCLRRGMCTLRIMAQPDRGPDPPTCVARIGH